MFEKLWKSDKRKVKKLVEGKNFDWLIMSAIFMAAIIMGLLTATFATEALKTDLFVLDRLFLAIFIAEMVMKIFAYGKGFFKNGWNVFDFTVIAVSIIPSASYFIILRTFRLFRLLRYINKFSRLKQVINTFLALLPNFTAMLAVFSVFMYVFAIIAVSLFGEVFVEFSSLGNSLFALLQIFTLDGWASDIARPVMSIYPHSWIYFVSFVLISLLIVISFLMSAVSEIVKRQFNPKARL